MAERQQVAALLAAITIAIEGQEAAALLDASPALSVWSDPLEATPPNEGRLAQSQALTTRYKDHDGRAAAVLGS